MSVNFAQAIEFAKELPFFKGLAERDLDALFASAVIAEFSRHQMIFEQGDSAAGLFVIINGWVKKFSRTAEGEEAVAAVLTRGDIFGERSVLAQAEYSLSAEAAEEAQILVMSGEILRQCANNNPDIMARIIASMSRNMKTLQMENEHLSLMSAPQRVGCLLLQLTSGLIGKGGTFVFPYDKSLAAARLGMKPETFSRALAQLSPHGVISHGSEITIENFNKLIGFCCGHCSLQSGECRGTCRGNCGSKS